MGSKTVADFINLIAKYPINAKISISAYNGQAEVEVLEGGGWVTIAHENEWGGY